VEYKDYYQLLGVSREAPQEAIAKAFKKAARKFHPDLNPNDKQAETKFKEINEAYEVLRDPEKRKLYDSFGHNWQHGQNFQPPPGYENARFHFGGAAGQGQGFGGAEFSDFFESIFGGLGGFGGAQAGFAGGQPRPRRGQDVEAGLELTLEEAYAGGAKSVTLHEQVLGPDNRPRLQTKNLSVNIPAGVRDGAKIRLAGQGEPGRMGGPAGDMYLKVMIRPHSRFKLEDVNVVVDLPLSPWEATLGATVRVPTLEGEIDLAVPPGSSSLRKLRIRGKGLMGREGRGDQFVRIVIHVPKELSPKEREAWLKLAEDSTFNPREH
jgi:curved DNA-binding protein